VADDERLGLPSASGLQRIVECPASLPLTVQLRDRGELPPDRGSEDADRGTRIHEVLEAFATGAELPADVDPEEFREAEALWERSQTILTRTFGEDLSGVELLVEKRFWLMDENGEKSASGRYDLIGVSEARKEALVIDYKSGWGEVAPAEHNYQLGFAAAVLHEAYGVERVTACINQTGSAPDTAVFTEKEIGLFLYEIDMALSRKDADPFELGFRKGHRCTYCPARLACPAHHYALAQVQASPLAILASTPTPRLDEFLVKLESVDVIAKAARAEMEARLRNGETAANWHLEASAGKRQVTNAAALANAIIAEGAPLGDVLGAMSLPVGKAESLLGAATKLKGKPLKNRLAEIGGQHIAITEPKPTLKRK